MKWNPLMPILVLFLTVTCACISEKGNDGYANVKDFGARGTILIQWAPV
jgi:hypothetical protein